MFPGTQTHPVQKLSWNNLYGWSRLPGFVVFWQIHQSAQSFARVSVGGRRHFLAGRQIQKRFPVQAYGGLLYHKQGVLPASLRYIYLQGLGYAGRFCQGRLHLVYHF